MDKKQVILNTQKFVKDRLLGESSGHDWWHIQRVWDLSKHIAKNENEDLFVVEMVALLHDVSDWKICGDELCGIKIIREWLTSQGFDKNFIKIIEDAIGEISFSKGLNLKKEKISMVGKIVQDADRLDAIGAIGIARCFAYGGYKGREIYNPNIKPIICKTTEEYRKNASPSLNHFYEKLLLLKDKMNTETAKKMAEKRHKFMEKYLEEFFAEWKGKN